MSENRFTDFFKGYRARPVVSNELKKISVLCIATSSFTQKLVSVRLKHVFLILQLRLLTENARGISQSFSNQKISLSVL